MSEHSLSIPTEIWSTESGSTNIAASPATSGSEVVLEVITGVPHAIDSTTGKPKPSYRDGNTSAKAPSVKTR